MKLSQYLSEVRDILSSRRLRWDHYGIIITLRELGDSGSMIILDGSGTVLGLPRFQGKCL